MKKLLIFAGAILVAMLLSGVSYCQDENLDYSYGSVVEVNKEGNQITVNEYDWEGDKEIAVIYAVHPEVELENANALDSIPDGSYVDIEYVASVKGEKVAKRITVYEPENEVETE